MTDWMKNVAVSLFEEASTVYSKPTVRDNNAGNFIELSAEAIQFGFCVYEGMRVYVANGQYNIFRAKDHHDRLVHSASRLLMPAPDYRTFLDTLRLAVESNAAEEGSHLYLRPLLYAIDGGIMPPNARRFAFSAHCTVFPRHFEDISLRLEANNLRTVPAFQTIKTASNYAASALANAEAKKAGYDSVLWTDAKGNVTECTTMNIFFLVNGVYVTPPAGDVLSGVTRMTIMEYLAENGHRVIERPVSAIELRSKIASGEISHVFTTSTALGINTVTSIGFPDGAALTIDGAMPAELKAIRKHYSAITANFPEGLNRHPSIASKSYVGTVKSIPANITV